MPQSQVPKEAHTKLKEKESLTETTAGLTQSAPAALLPPFPSPSFVAIRVVCKLILSFHFHFFFITRMYCYSEIAVSVKTFFFKTLEGEHNSSHENS